MVLGSHHLDNMILTLVDGKLLEAKGKINSLLNQQDIDLEVNQNAISRGTI